VEGGGHALMGLCRRSVTKLPEVGHARSTCGDRRALALTIPEAFFISADEVIVGLLCCNCLQPLLALLRLHKPIP
jgi:hypothetical protein